MRITTFFAAAAMMFATSVSFANTSPSVVCKNNVEIKDIHSDTAFKKKYTTKNAKKTSPANINDSNSNIR
ncbi:hypothetical protein D3C87_112090 [compost metagenome]